MRRAALVLAASLLIAATSPSQHVVKAGETLTHTVGEGRHEALRPIGFGPDSWTTKWWATRRGTIRYSPSQVRS